MELVDSEEMFLGECYIQMPNVGCIRTIQKYIWRSQNSQILIQLWNACISLYAESYFAPMIGYNAIVHETVISAPQLQ